MLVAYCKGIEHCAICGFGTCQAALRPCPRIEPPDLHWQLLSQYERQMRAERVPNRLYGATINHRGEAV